MEFCGNKNAGGVIEPQHIIVNRISSPRCSNTPRGWARVGSAPTYNRTTPSPSFDNTICAKDPLCLVNSSNDDDSDNDIESSSECIPSNFCDSVLDNVNGSDDSDVLIVDYVNKSWKTNNRKFKIGSSDQNRIKREKFRSSKDQQQNSSIKKSKLSQKSPGILKKVAGKKDNGDHPTSRNSISHEEPKAEVCTTNLNLTPAGNCKDESKDIETLRKGICFPSIIVTPVDISSHKVQGSCPTAPKKTDVKPKKSLATPSSQTNNKTQINKMKKLETSKAQDNNLLYEMKGPFVRIIGSDRNKPDWMGVVNGPKDPLDAKMSRNPPQIDLGYRNLPMGHTSATGPKYDSKHHDETWICVFCQRYSHFGGMGDLFGPYFIKGYGRQNSKRPLADKREVWFHEDCICWFPEIRLVGLNTILGLESAISVASESVCRECGCYGSGLACMFPRCKALSHYYCAKRANWNIMPEKFQALCKQHAEKATPS